MGWMAAESESYEPVEAGRRTTLPPAARQALRTVRGRQALRTVRDWVRASPGTHVWLLVLGVTSGVIAFVSPEARSFLLHHNSTNLFELRDHPVRVLVASALWIETPAAFLFYVVFFELVHAPAERWLGTGRWLLTAALAHIGATLFSQQAVLLGIRYERLPQSMAHTVDIGVSYGLAGVVGVLAYRVPRRLRWGYVAGVTGFFGYPVLRGHTFTDLGHFTALLLGYACYAVTPDGRGLRQRRR